MIDVELDLVAGDLDLAAQGRALAVRVLPSGEVLLEGAGVRAEIASDSGSASLRGPLAAYPLDTLLRLLLSRALLQRGGLLLHACAVVIDGLAVIFAGPSGSGKTTLGEEMPGLLMSDEAVAVVAAPGRGIMAYATPYWRGSPARAPVGALLLVGRGSRASWRSPNLARAAGQVFHEAGPFTPDIVAAGFDAACRLLDSIPTCAAVSLSSKAEIRGWLLPRLRGCLAARAACQRSSGPHAHCGLPPGREELRNTPAGMGWGSAGRGAS